MTQKTISTTTTKTASPEIRQDVNPYKYKEPLDPERDQAVCVPREHEVLRVINGIRHGDYWAVIGPRQVGKTTFMRQVQREYPDAYCVYINFKSPETDVLRFYRSIIDAFDTFVPSAKRPDLDKTWSEYRPELAFLNYLENFQPEDDSRKVILFFDEIEKIATVSQFLHLWRKIYRERYYKPGLNRYAVVLAGSADLIHLTSGSNSPFNIAEIYNIRDFDYEESRGLIHGPLEALRIDIRPEAEHRLFSQLSGHPQMMQHLLHILVARVLEEKNGRQQRVIRDVDVARGIMTLFNTSSVLETLKHNIALNNVLEELLRDILSGGKKMFFSNKEFAVAGVGPIIEEDTYCALRNAVFEEYIKGILEDKSRKAHTPVGHKLLNLQDRIRRDVNTLKEYDEQLAYEDNFFIRQKCEEDLDRLQDALEGFELAHKNLEKQSGASADELNINIANLLQKMILLTRKVGCTLRQKRVLDHYLISDTASIVANTVKMHKNKSLITLENIIVALHSGNIREILMHQTLSDFNLLSKGLVEGKIACKYHLLEKQLRRVAEKMPNVKAVSLRFMLCLPLLPLILQNKKEFEAVEEEPGFDVGLELNEMEEKWRQLLDIVQPDKST